MNLGVTLKWDAKELAKFESYPKEYEKALEAAVSRVTRWANAELMRALPAGTGIQLKAIKQRVRVTILKTFGCIFVGLDPISARWLNPKQTAGGVQAGGQFFPGAFIVGGSGPLAGQVMVRRYPHDPNPKKHGLPIDKATVPLLDKGMPILEHIFNQANQLLDSEFKAQFKRLT